MTTALIGKKGLGAPTARVALVSRGACAQLASAITRAGHEVLEYTEWSGVAAAADANSAIDLVLYEDETVGNPPAELPFPAVLVTERTNVLGATSLGAASAAAIEQMLQPLLALAVQLSQSARRCHELERLFEGIRSGAALVGRSPLIRRLQGALSRAADSDATVLVEGPHGTGKSLAARMIHCKSRRCDRPLVSVACADSNAELLTRALETTKSSTLVLEDIERLPLPAQAVLVRHLKERSATQLGSAPRLVATTAAHLPELVAKGAFREDLYYRLHAMPIVMPALRERVEDVPMLAEAILDACQLQTGRQHPGFTPAARMLLESMPWPGNVTQLEAAVRRAVVLAGGASIDRDHLLTPPTGAPAAAAPAAAGAARTENEEVELTEDAIRPFEEEEQALLSRALRATKGNVRRAAQLLGIGRATLYRKIQQYRLRLQ